MRKTTLVTVIALGALALGGFVFIAQPFSPDRRTVVDLSERFVEDLQFKDFRSSSLYHHRLEQGRVDIGRALERLFLVKPELLDIQSYRIVRAEVDSTGDRARVLVNTRFRRLNQKDEPEEADLMLYWIRRHPDCPIGGTCAPEGRCVSEYGDVLYQPEDDTRKARERELADPTDTGKTGEPYSCDSAAQPAWFMNLDSTLKDKQYNH